MNYEINPLEIRRILGRENWQPPKQPKILGMEHQWWFDHKVNPTRIIVSSAPYDDIEWIHASISHTDVMPTYEDLKLLHEAVFNDGWAYQIFAPKERHYNYHTYALHLWGRADGKMVHPDFQAITGLRSI